MTKRFDSFILDGTLFEGAYTVDSVLATKNFQGRPDDIHLTTYPRTGTTWTQNILIGMIYGLETLKDIDNFNMRSYFPYLELVHADGKTGAQIADEITKTPRMMKNHLPPNLAPQEIFTLKRKNIVIVRNPKDTALSLNKFYQTNNNLQPFYNCDNLKAFLDKFLDGNVCYGGWWEWTKNWIDICRRHPENNLLIYYEDLHEHFETTIAQLASFLNLEPLDSQTVEELKDLTSVDSMKQRLEVKKDYKGKGIINKGQMNSWKGTLSSTYVDKFDKLTRETFDDSVVYKFL